RINAGLTFEYSIPYLESKVAATGLPAWLQNVTPQVEMLLMAPTRSVSGNATTAVIAPGLLYAGEGWEFGIEALIPLNAATGGGAGVIAQLHFSLDYFFPTTIGAPLFSPR